MDPSDRDGTSLRFGGEWGRGMFESQGSARPRLGTPGLHDESPLGFGGAEAYSLGDKSGKVVVDNSSLSDRNDSIFTSEVYLNFLSSRWKLIASHHIRHE